MGQQIEVPTQEVVDIAREAYVFGYPIVVMDVTGNQATNVSDASSTFGRAPTNQFAHFRAYPGDKDRDIVRFNFDTLYSFAWLDLSDGPIVLSVPDFGDRYYLIPALDMWTDVFSSVGTRTTGNKAGSYAYVPPGWTGDLPEGIERIDAPTQRIWVMGRVQTNGPQDYENVHRLQDGLSLTPLAHWGKKAIRGNQDPQPINDSIDPKTPPMYTVQNLTGVAFFQRLSELINEYPPHLVDSPILFRLKRIGIERGKKFNTQELSKDLSDALNQGAVLGSQDIVSKIKRGNQSVNGWNILNEFMGVYGASYLQRGAIAMAGIGANLQEDAVYPTAFTDGDGRPLDSSKRYVMRFPKGQTPPCQAFWSLTMYDGDGFQVSNELNRYSIGSRDDLKVNEDGSIDIYLQHDRPDESKVSNWLPAPASGPMGPTMRIYAPRPTVLDGSWNPPPLLRSDN